MRSLVDEMMEQMAQQGGALQPGQNMLPPMSNRDPLGREMPNAGSLSTQDVQIPNEADVQRAREILNELRRRLGQHQRPPIEHDYIERLLRQF
jgi:hypothetical protein